MQFSPWQRALSGCLLALGLVSAVRAQTVQGTIRLVNGAVAPYSIVLFVQNGQERARAIADSDGKYYFERIPPGTYEVRVLRGGSVVSRKTVQVPNSGATVDLQVR